MNLNEMNLNLTGSEITLRQQEVARTSSVKKLSDTYNEHAKLVFIFDCSGSMAAKMPKSSEMGTVREADMKSRLDVVRTLAKQEIKARFDKYPKSRVAVIAFGDNSIIVFDDGDAADLWPQLERMKLGRNQYDCNCNFGGVEKQALDYSGKPAVDADGKPIMTYEGGQTVASGGTDILLALRTGMDVCRAKPSAVGIHHFVLVSDGGDYRCDSAMSQWTPVFKASGVILDYIHIGGEGEVNEGLRRAAKETGGDAVVVSNEDDLTEKFIAAAQRLMLPPGK